MIIRTKLAGQQKRVFIKSVFIEIYTVKQHLVESKNIAKIR